MDEQLCMLGFGVSLSEKIDKAIGTYQMYEAEALRRDPVNGYYLCDSYGKDSCVILDLAKRSGVKFLAHYNLTTLDPPELVRFGRKHHPETVVHKPDMPMLVRLVGRCYGPPTRLARWCCEEYKEIRGNDVVKVFGVRAAESARRKANWKIWTPHKKTQSWILNPILYWTDDDVWQYIWQNHLPYCSLYDEGLTRLGCIGCPMAGDGRRKEFERWPKYGEAWKRAIVKFYDKWHGVPTEQEKWNPCPVWWTTKELWDGERLQDKVWTVLDTKEFSVGQVVHGFINRRRWFDLPDSGIHSGGDMWHWWMEELPQPDEDDCQMGLF